MMKNTDKSQSEQSLEMSQSEQSLELRVWELPDLFHQASVSEAPDESLLSGSSAPSQAVRAAGGVSSVQHSLRFLCSDGLVSLEAESLYCILSRLIPADLLKPS